MEGQESGVPNSLVSEFIVLGSDIVEIRHELARAMFLASGLFLI